MIMNAKYVAINNSCLQQTIKILNNKHHFYMLQLIRESLTVKRSLNRGRQGWGGIMLWLSTLDFVTDRYLSYMRSSHYI